MEIVIESIKADKELRPYFFDFICKGFILGLSDTFQVADVDRIRFQKDYYGALMDLSAELDKKVGPNEVLPVIHHVSTYYLAHIGRIGIEDYRPRTN